ncbi:MAG: FAD synthetase family protein [Spirochaetales bacterium]|nr:FAD synthetase family protein [Spirochaetales bacterium]
MRKILWQEAINGKAKVLNDASVTIGVFDGLHSGHRVLIKRIVHNSHNYLPVVVTFKENPAKLLQGDKFSGDILTENQKMVKLAGMGVYAVVLIDFSYNFSRISAENFFNFLNAAFTIKEMVVGYNFHFGNAQSADSDVLKKLTTKEHIALEVLRPVTYRKQVVSSTRIREAIYHGLFDKVKAMLGDEYVVQIPGKSLVRRLDQIVFLKKDAITQVLPMQGRYLCTYNPMRENEKGEVEIKDKELICKVEDDIHLESLCFMKPIAVNRNLSLT